MRRPGIPGGIALAFGSAVLAFPVWWALAGLLPTAAALRLVLTGAYLGYCLYLLRTAGTRVGMVSLLALNLALALGVGVLPLRVPAAAAVLAGLLSLNRSLLFHRSLLAMGLDGLVSLAGLAFSGYLLAGGGGVPAALWGFFLLQSVFPLIPPPDSAFSGAREETDPFLHGQRQAEAALERMAGHP